MKGGVWVAAGRARGVGSGGGSGHAAASVAVSDGGAIFVECVSLSIHFYP